jgi:hypothetical protein
MSASATPTGGVIKGIEKVLGPALDDAHDCGLVNLISLGALAVGGIDLGQARLA